MRFGLSLSFKASTTLARDEVHAGSVRGILQLHDDRRELRSFRNRARELHPRDLSLRGVSLRLESALQERLRLLRLLIRLVELALQIPDPVDLWKDQEEEERHGEEDQHDDRDDDLVSGA